jgi:hypothetical protein
VTERKVCLFLNEVAFKRKRVVKKGKAKKRKRGDASSDEEESGVMPWLIRL